MAIKVKKFLKENAKFLIFLLLFYFVMNFELPYVIYAPGGAINMSERVTGDNTYHEDGSLSMTYVSMVKGSIPFLALSYIIPNWDIVEKDKITYDENTLKDIMEIDKIYMMEAISNAQIVAYENAQIDYNILNSKNVITYVDKDANINLKYGDELVSIDEYDFNSLNELIAYLTNKSIGDKVKVKYKREKKEYEEFVALRNINGEAKIGLSMASISDYETSYNIEVKTKSSESGPSGGLITALEIYNQITENDITHGKTVMGTGTIDKDGTVGEIAGVKYKLIGAIKKGAEVFICPEENYKEAVSVSKKNNYNIKIISAHTFKEAIEKLSSI